MSDTNRWRINRIGLINFWYYDDQEFWFEDGKLLLRGSNGSGKSVTMQSFIPLLFDGNKSPERLDPFGSRARKLENYLLSEDDTSQTENTGYLYMEFIKPGSGIYLTIGMGLRARRNRPIDFWGFSVTDGRRIGMDFMLYKDIGEKIPLSKIELRNRIGTGGEMHETQRGYMEMVNKLLFGYEDIDEYDELIKLLVQIRTPKLSKEFRPTVVYEIMNNSLQPLSDDDLRPLSEAIENMDKIKDQLEMLQESNKAAGRLKTEYDKYNRYILHEKAADYISNADSLSDSRRNIEKLKKQSADYLSEHNKAEERRAELKLLADELEHRRQKLEQNDAFKAKQELNGLETALAELNQKLSGKEVSLQQKKDREKSTEYRLRDAKEKQETREKELRDFLDTMKQLADDCMFEEHAFASAELLESLYKPYQFRLLKEDTDRYRTKINRARKALDEMKHKERDYDEKLQELERGKKDRSQAERDLAKANTQFQGIKEEFIENIHLWQKKNSLLKIDREDMPELIRAAEAYGENVTYEDIREIARRHYVDIEKVYRARILEHESAKKGFEDDIREQQAELQTWKDKRDPEPAREEKAVLNREALKAAGVPFLPFYQAVDFKKDTPDDIKGRIEEALGDMGILDALIIPGEYQNKLPESGESEGDRYILPDPHYFTHELSFYLEPVVPQDSPITYEDIDNVLKSILLDDKSAIASVNEAGEYRIGLLCGNTTTINRPKYLGAESRKRYRQEIIESLEREIESIRLLAAERDRLIEGLQQEIRILESELAAFPGKADLETAYMMVKDAENTLLAREKEVRRRQEAADKLFAELKALRDKVRELTHGMMLPLTPEDYEEAENSINRYSTMVSELETLHNNLLNTVQTIATLNEQMEQILDDLDALYVDIRELHRDIDLSLARKENLLKVLEQTDYESIKAEIDNCIRGLEEIPDKRDEAVRASEQNKKDYEQSLRDLEQMQLRAETLRNLTDIAEESFRLEYGLKYVTAYDDLTDIYQIAKRILTDLKLDEKSVRLREDYVNALTSRYHENMQYLVEYSPRIDMAFETSIESEAGEAAKLLAKRKRHEIMAKVHGRDVDFYTMLEDIRQSIDENEKLLKESDRQLFEDILANTVGKKIRQRIYHSERWVSKINALMESMDTSSGLSFSLSWKKNVAETEDQLDTRELVELLQSDAVLLSEEEMARLTNHFRSKIVQARKNLENAGNTLSFHTIMRDILDYRKWFEFQLYYKKTGEQRKELTDNAFYKFSGGEKAMAMYVPLFSSVYARFDGASRKDCPRVISLDEAFAGVDDNNIADMFRLIEELGLDYIINSQVLWGDYESVPALSIYELIRPNNVDYVTTIRYVWNGKVRSLAES